MGFNNGTKMLRALPLLTGGMLLLLLKLQGIAAFAADILETSSISEASVIGKYDIPNSFEFQQVDGVDPLDSGCSSAGRCIGALTRDGSQDLNSRYGCTMPEGGDLCGVTYDTVRFFDEFRTISSVKIGAAGALHPDSVRSFNITLNSDRELVEQWDAMAGTTDMQEISVLQGLELRSFKIEGNMEVGEQLGILEVEINVEVAAVVISGASASTRSTISATATSDPDTAMNTLDGDATDGSSWTCSSGEVCDITYDLQAAESLEQLRIAFSDDSDAGGHFNVMAAGESGDFFSVRSGVEAGGRPPSSDGFQTFGAMLAVARYVKIEAVPARGGSIVINEVDFRVGVEAPARPVAEKKWLQPTGPLPRAGKYAITVEPDFDSRSASDGGCDSPIHFDGCRVIFIKDGDMDTRWSCGLADGDCAIDFGLIYFRYVRQIQFAFHLGDEQHAEFNIRAFTARGWVTVVPSAITSGDTTGYQTFDVSVHTNLIQLTLRHQRYTQWIGINEAIILEQRENDFVDGTVPVFSFQQVFTSFADGEDEDIDTPSHFEFDVPDAGDWTNFIMSLSTVTAVRMRFPANRKFVFQIEYSVDDEDVVDTFTTAGGPNTWEEFTLSQSAPETSALRFVAVSGPSFDNVPDYPTFRVVDFQVVGEPTERPRGHFEAWSFRLKSGKTPEKMVSTNTEHWDVIPDIIADGVSDQEDIMTAICETKGATFNGTDCVGELDDSTVFINMRLGHYFVDRPIFIKSGVTLSGSWSSAVPSFSFLLVYEGSNSGNTGEDGIIVIDGATDAEVHDFLLGWKEDPIGDVVPGTLGNLGVDVKNSQDLRFENLAFSSIRAGAAQFVDSRNISSFQLFTSTPEVGSYMDLIRVDEFVFEGFPSMPGLRIEDCNDVLFLGVFDEYKIPNPKLDPPSTNTDQTANVVITGDSTGIVFKNVEVGEGPEPRILVESTAALTLDYVEEYEDALSGDCIVQVPEGSTEDSLIQINSAQSLSLSGNCWVLD